MRIFTGSLSDGSSAAVETVRVIPGDNGLRIVRRENGEEEFWPYDALVTSGPLLEGHDTLLSHMERPGIRLHIPDTALAGLLLQKAPHLGSRAHHRRILLPLIAISMLVVAISAFLLLSDYSPSRAIAGMIPEKVRISMGETLARSMAGENGFCNTPDGRRALDRIIDRLAAGNAKIRPYRVEVARMPMVNAFTVPGRLIVISNALLRLTDTPEELAGVIAHEMGHAMELHPETSLVRSLGISAAFMLLGGGSSDMLTEMAAFLLQMSYSRKAEREADDQALHLLRNSAISARPLALFFEKLKRDGDMEDNRLLELFSTHPITKDRLARIRSAGTWPSRPLLGAAEWEALRHMCD